MLAVLTGLLLVHRPHCADAMVANSGIPISAASASSVTMTGVVSCPADAASRVAAGRSADSVVDMAGCMDGLLASCLAFIVAALASLLGLRLSWRQIAVTARRPHCAPRIPVVVPRAPSLADLCLLRT